MPGVRSHTALTRLGWLAGLVLVFGVMSAAHAERPSREVSMQFLTDLVTRAAGAMSSSEGDVLAREEVYRELLGNGFHMPFIARVSLGKHWRRISDSERDEYTELFSEFVLRSYGPRLGGFDPERFHVKDAVERGKQDMLVQSIIEQPSGPDVTAGWRVRLVDGKPKIVDIVVEGVSMALNQRREFLGVMAQSGITGLMEMLRARTERLSVDPPS